MNVADSVGEDIFLKSYWFVFPVFKKELEDDIKSDTSGDFRTALLALCKVVPPMFVSFVLNSLPSV